MLARRKTSGTATVTVRVVGPDGPSAVRVNVVVFEIRTCTDPLAETAPGYGEIFTEVASVVAQSSLTVAPGVAVARLAVKRSICTGGSTRLSIHAVGKKLA